MRPAKPIPPPGKDRENLDCGTVLLGERQAHEPQYGLIEQF
jgi:hypothetical protein